MTRGIATIVQIEIALAVVSATLFALTLVHPPWIEVLTGVKPDAGTGSTEFLIAGAFLLMSVALGGLARRTYRRLAAR